MMNSDAKTDMGYVKKNRRISGKYAPHEVLLCMGGISDERRPPMEAAFIAYAGLF